MGTGRASQGMERLFAGEVGPPPERLVLWRRHAPPPCAPGRATLPRAALPRRSTFPRAALPRRSTFPRAVLPRRATLPHGALPRRGRDLVATHSSEGGAPPE